MEPLSDGVVILYHGTSIRSGLALLNGAPLDITTAAAQKLDGPPGFFLATRAEDAALLRGTSRRGNHPQVRTAAMGSATLARERRGIPTNPRW